MTSQIRPCLLVALLVIGLAAPCIAGERMKHSGTIVSIADDGTSFVLAEIGPWQLGGALVTRRTITITPGTRFAIVARAEAAPSGFAGDFVELDIERQGLYLDDFVTVDCRHEGRRLIALKITVTDIPVAETILIGSAR